jgi:hypothetical protein
MLNRTARAAARALYGIDHGIDWIYSTLASKTALVTSSILRRVHNGNVNRYVWWVLAGAVAVLLAVLAAVGGGR